MSKFWPFLAQASFFACVACFYPFLVLYYQQQGFNGPQIGLLTGLTPLMILLGAPLWTNLADATRHHRLILSAVMLVTLLSLAVLPWLHAFALVLLLIVLLSLCYAPITAFIDSATMAMLGRQREQYGRVRVGGTLGYGLTAVLIGLLVQRAGLQAAFLAGAVILLIALLAAQHLSFGPAHHDPSAAGGVRALLADRRWWPFLVLVFAAGLALSLSNTYLLAFMQELGAAPSSMGLALTMGTVMEVPMLLIGHRLIARYRPYALFMLAVFFTGLRTLFFAFSRTPTAVIWLQLLNGITFPLAWMAGVAYAHDQAPARLSATAQGLFGAVFSGFGAAVGNFAGGPLFERFGGHVTYLIFAVAVLGIVLLVWLVQRLAPVADTAAALTRQDPLGP